MVDKINSVENIDFTPFGEVFSSPIDWRDNFIYFLLIDRFDDNSDVLQAYDPATASKDRGLKDGKAF